MSGRFCYFTVCDCHVIHILCHVTHWLGEISAADLPLQCSVNQINAALSGNTKTARPSTFRRRCPNKVRTGCWTAHKSVSILVRCPNVSSLDKKDRLCAELCSKDRDCGSGRACCWNGCGHVCLKPEGEIDSK